MRKPEPIDVRLARRSRLNELTGCLEWQGAVDKDGYGFLEIAKKGYRAHRISYELHIGPIPNGFNVCHKCDNRRCINANHLFIGTQKDNMQDCSKKGRLRDQKGALSTSAILSPEDILKIRADTRTHREIAKVYNISCASVSLIKNYKQWTNVSPSPTHIEGRWFYVEENTNVGC